MAKKISEEDILRIKEEYNNIGTYSGVSKKLGFAASTIKKYVLLQIESPSDFSMTEKDLGISNLDNVYDLVEGVDYDV